MPMLFALGQLVEAQARLSDNEHLFAFLDDVYITNQPGRVTEAHTVVEEELWTHAGIEKPKCGTVVWSLKASRS